MAQVLTDPAIARHVKDAWPDTQSLLVAGEAVDQLQLQPGWALVLDIIDREIATIDLELDAGRKPLEQAEYALAHGRRGGLRILQMTVQTIVTKYTAELERQRRKHEAGGESSADRETA